MSDVQFQPESSSHTQESTPAERQEITLESSNTKTLSNQEDFFDVDHANTPIGWNEHKLSDSVTFGGTHAKSIDSFIEEDTKKTKEPSTLIDTDTTNDSVHDLMPDMDSAGLWISAASVAQTNNQANNHSQALNKAKEDVSNINIATSQPKTSSHRLHGVILCISISTVGLFIYLHSDTTNITSGSKISHNVNIKFNETLTNVEKKYDELYEEIVSNIQNRTANALKIQKNQTKEEIQKNIEAQNTNQNN